MPEAPTMIGIKLHAMINKLILSLSSYIVQKNSLYISGLFSTYVENNGIGIEWPTFNESVLKLLESHESLGWHKIT